MMIFDRLKYVNAFPESLSLAMVLPAPVQAIGLAQRLLKRQIRILRIILFKGFSKVCIFKRLPNRILAFWAKSKAIHTLDIMNLQCKNM